MTFLTRKERELDIFTYAFKEILAVRLILYRHTLACREGNEWYKIVVVVVVLRETEKS